MVKQKNKLYADDGMILTDGAHYGYEVNLADDADASEWYEISQEEYTAMMDNGEEF